MHASGYYSNEPLFGEILREARRLGYTLVPYEAIGATSQDARETGQATNLRDRIFRDHPDARVLVHAGYSHIDESGTLGGAKPMAVRFRELTGIDPLTVDQTTMREHATRDRERGEYRHVVDRAGWTMPFVLVEPTGQAWTNRPGVHDDGIPAADAVTRREAGLAVALGRTAAVSNSRCALCRTRRVRRRGTGGRRVERCRAARCGAPDT